MKIYKMSMPKELKNKSLDIHMQINGLKYSVQLFYCLLIFQKISDAAKRFIVHFGCGHVELCIRHFWGQGLVISKPLTDQ